MKTENLAIDPNPLSVVRIIGTDPDGSDITEVVERAPLEVQGAAISVALTIGQGKMPPPGQFEAVDAWLEEMGAKYHLLKGPVPRGD